MKRLARPWLIGITSLLAVLFAVFAGFQLNDTNPEIYHRPSVIDAWSWVVFYGFISALSVVSIFRPIPLALLGLAALFCIYEMATTAPGLYRNLFQADSFTMTGASMAPSRSEVELSREFFGALIGLIDITFLCWQTKKATRLVA